MAQVDIRFFIRGKQGDWKSKKAYDSYARRLADILADEGFLTKGDRVQAVRGGIGFIIEGIEVQDPPHMEYRAKEYEPDGTS